MGIRSVERLLRPQSVAIVGASATPGALGAAVVANLERMQFSGQMYLINPNRGTIGARTCLKAIEELPLGVDVAVLAIPRAAVISAVKSLSARQVGAAIIFSAGFAEGGASGLADQRELARIAAETGLVIEGPNCLGLVNYVDGIALTFVETPALALGARPGIGIVSQSGAMAAVIAVMLTAKHLGISYSVSTGNEAASGVEDYVEFLLDDAHTQVIALIVEQFRRPKRFLELAGRARAAGKPIVLLHPGRSRAARESAATHTGALAGDYSVMRTHVERAGVLVTETLEEFGDVLDVAARCSASPSGGAAVLTESGAFKALTLDLCEEIGLPLPIVTDESAPLLRTALPEFVPVSNPVDLTAQGLVDPGLYRRVLAALLQDERFGCVIFAIIQTDERTCAAKFPTIIEAIRELKSKKPMVFAGLDEGAAVPEEYIAQLRALQVPYFPSPGRALRAVARTCAAAKARAGAATDGGPAHKSVDAPQLHLQLLGGGPIPEYRAKEILKPLGVPFPVGRMVKTVEAAARAAADIGYPVVFKAQSADLPHKSDAGGVVLNIKDAHGIAAAWARLHANITRSRPDLLLEGVLVEHMSKPGVELIIGGRNDPDWGPIMLAGFGGVQAEILKDVRFMAPDLSIDEITCELNKLKSGELLRGYRGAPALDVLAVAQIVARLGALLLAEASLKEIDLNPVIVYPTGAGAIALDALIIANQKPQASRVSAESIAD
jgi:acyl-CoA synthetase (NDP forming)